MLKILSRLFLRGEEGMKIVVASHNKKKIRELNALLGKYIDGVELLSLDDVGMTDEIVEDGNSFEENAFIKARAAARSGYIGVGDDSGLCVDALLGAPGIFSARYAGEHGDDEANNELLLKNLADKPTRAAEFVCALACVFPDGEHEDFCVTGKARGEILKERYGEGGFGYDPLFYFPPLKKTFAEMDAEEKNEISHRGEAVKLLGKRLSEIKEK